MPAEVNEYSECAAQIRKAELAAAGRGGGGISGPGAGGGPSASIPPPSPAEQQKLQPAHPSAGAAPVTVGGQPVVPGVVHADIASAVSSLPTPLLTVLALLLTGAVAILVRAIQGRVHLRREGSRQP